jgi:hypothetical protein
MGNRSNRDELAFLQDILDCIARIEVYLEGVIVRRSLSVLSYDSIDCLARPGSL